MLKKEEDANKEKQEGEIAENGEEVKLREQK